ncbi:hypothetical protein FRX31_030229 [Thalictrum thalictroides]|uniref:Uncharacterized protein n=1 Tax=Thalictrum thalictroides TaxID=46969 RepID=A0A7J6V540_THATH|nr:hypothetical protein FRX31_030229 [Thalictrum thalictroides]
MRSVKMIVTVEGTAKTRLNLTREERQDNDANKGAIQEAKEDDGWEVPKRKHTCRVRWGSMGSTQGLQVVDNDKDEERYTNNMEKSEEGSSSNNNSFYKGMELG